MSNSDGNKLVIFYIITSPLNTDFLHNDPLNIVFDSIYNNHDMIRGQAGTIAGIVVATDSDAYQTLTYTIISGNTTGAFAIKALTGELTVTMPAVLDYELTRSFTLIVQVQDNGTGNLSSQDTVTLNLIEVNESPVMNNQSFSIPEQSAPKANTIGRKAGIQC